MREEKREKRREKRKERREERSGGRVTKLHSSLFWQNQLNLYVGFGGSNV
jgi:hypothetical protein